MERILNHLEEAEVVQLDRLVVDQCLIFNESLMRRFHS